MSDILKGLAGDAGFGQAQLARMQADSARAQSLSKAGHEGPNGQAPAHDIDKVSSQFEALLVKQMLGAMWRSVPQGGLLSGSHEEEIYRDMFNDTVAESIAEKQSMGIKAVIKRELTKAESK
jgi:Rod binding domain-containing protein